MFHDLRQLSSRINTFDWCAFRCRQHRNVATSLDILTARMPYSRGSHCAVASWFVSAWEGHALQLLRQRGRHSIPEYGKPSQGDAVDWQTMPKPLQSHVPVHGHHDFDLTPVGGTFDTAKTRRTLRTDTDKKRAMEKDLHHETKGAGNTNDVHPLPLPLPPFSFLPLLPVTPPTVKSVETDTCMCVLCTSMLWR